LSFQRRNPLRHTAGPAPTAIEAGPFFLRPPDSPVVAANFLALNPHFP
jgi:hypothetical protein